MLHYTKLKRLGKDKHSSLLGPFVSYKEDEVLNIFTSWSKKSFITFVQGVDDCSCELLMSYLAGNKINKFHPKSPSGFEPLAQCYKTFMGRNLRMFIIS